MSEAGATRSRRRFPMPPPLIVGLLDELRLAAERPPESKEELRWLAEMPRPWDPPTCPPSLQESLWRWLDEVAAWINEEHTWRVDRLIPICWKEHPHIAHELATVACLRFNAMYAVTPERSRGLVQVHAAALPRPDRATHRQRRVSSRAAPAVSGGCPARAAPGSDD